MGSLDGVVAVITGAGRGIGREHALLFAREGAKVIVNDLGGNPDGSGQGSAAANGVVEEIEQAGGEAAANHADVSEPAGAQALVAAAIATFGHLDVLVNNAGVLRDRALVNLTEDDWDVVIRVNLRATFLTSQAAARHWRERHKAGDPLSGSLINTSSESGVFANAGQANYGAAKSGVATLTQICAKELKRYGARANAVLPRARTRLTEGILGAPKSTAVFDRWHPANVSPFVAFLATPGCPFTGETFLVGGSSIQRVRPWELDDDWKLEGNGRWTITELMEIGATRGPMSPASGGGLIT